MRNGDLNNLSQPIALIHTSGLHHRLFKGKMKNCTVVFECAKPNYAYSIELTNDLLIDLVEEDLKQIDYLKSLPSSEFDYRDS